MITLLGVLLLSACGEKPHDYHYYVLHPEKIPPALAQCRNQELQRGAVSQNCQMVSRAYQDTRSLLVQVEEDPVTFGKKILAAQVQLANDRQALASAQKTFKNIAENTANTEPASPQLVLARQQLRVAQAKVASQEMVVNRFYAIVRMVGE